MAKKETVKMEKRKFGYLLFTHIDIYKYEYLKYNNSDVYTVHVEILQT